MKTLAWFGVLGCLTLGCAHRASPNQGVAWATSTAAPRANQGVGHWAQQPQIAYYPMNGNGPQSDSTAAPRPGFEGNYPSLTGSGLAPQDTGYSATQGSAPDREPSPAMTGTSTGAAPVSGARGLQIPGGAACLARLEQMGVKYLDLDEQRGVTDPVGISQLGGIRWYSSANSPMVADCRLAVALAELGPQLARAGVTDALFSGAYSYRMSRVGRLSLHAYGLAVDIHGFTVQGRPLTIRQDYVRGLGGDAPNAPPPVNQIANILRKSGLFSEFLTPDHNADHWDHIHVGVAPLDHPHWIKKIPVNRPPITSRPGLSRNSSRPPRLPSAPTAESSSAAGTNTPPAQRVPQNPSRATPASAGSEDSAAEKADPSPKATAEDLWETAPGEDTEPTPSAAPKAATDRHAAPMPTARGASAKKARSKRSPSRNPSPRSRPLAARAP